MDQHMIDKFVYDNAIASTQYILEALPHDLKHPSIGVICGSGLSGLSDIVQHNPRVEIPYGKIPNFPRSTGKEIF